MKKSLAGLVGLVGLAVFTAPALAATATGTLNVNITISASCNVVSASAINFGTVGAISANLDQTSTLVVNCSNTTPYTVSLGAGSGTGATVATRRMMNGTNAVNYTLYRDAARTQIWGTTIGTDTLAGTGNGANQSITIFGRVPAQATPAPGAYTDTVNITITY